MSPPPTPASGIVPHSHSTSSTRPPATPRRRPPGPNPLRSPSFLGGPSLLRGPSRLPGPRGSAAPPRICPEVTYTDHLRQDHRRRALRPVPPDSHPPLPISPAPEVSASAPRPARRRGAVTQLPSRYHGPVPAIRRVDGGGRVLWDGLAYLLGWEPGLALEASTTAARSAPEDRPYGREEARPARTQRG